MMKEHDAAGELVKQIRKASSEYTAPADACTSYKALYQDLREFEADLHQHVHLENNILFPPCSGNGNCSRLRCHVNFTQNN